jgi:opacity protein-like surface antigen
MRLLLKLITITLLLNFFISRNSYAFFEKNDSRSSSRPIDSSSDNNGNFYLGAGYGQFINSTLNHLNSPYANGNTARDQQNIQSFNEYLNGDKSSDLGNRGQFQIYLGYTTPERWFRFELEFNRSATMYKNNISGNTSGTLQYLDELNKTSQFSSVKINIDQSLLMFNTYLQYSGLDDYNLFVGGGVGFAMLDMKLLGSLSESTTSGTQTTTKTTSKQTTINRSRVISPAYSAFIGVGYDLSSFFNVQARLRYTVVDSPMYSVSGGNIGSFNKNEKFTGNGPLIQQITLDLSGLFSI